MSEIDKNFYVKKYIDVYFILMDKFYLNDQKAHETTKKIMREAYNSISSASVKYGIESEEPVEYGKLV